METSTGRRPEEWLADAGYFDTEAIEVLRHPGIGVLIQPGKMRHRAVVPCNPLRRRPLASALLRQWMRYLVHMPGVPERGRQQEQSVEPVFG